MSLQPALHSASHSLSEHATPKLTLAPNAMHRLSTKLYRTLTHRNVQKWLTPSQLGCCDVARKYCDLVPVNKPTGLQTTLLPEDWTPIYRFNHIDIIHAVGNLRSWHAVGGGFCAITAGLAELLEFTEPESASVTVMMGMCNAVTHSGDLSQVTLPLIDCNQFTVWLFLFRPIQWPYHTLA